jgi:hypothetical protein
LALGAGAAAMRWLIMAQTADVTTLALIEPLHGLTFALFHLGYMHHCGYCPEQPRRFGAGVLWDRRNWRCNGPVDHTFRLAVRALGTCRILGNGFTMLRRVSHHLELARCAFTKSQSLDDHIIPIGTSLTTINA